MILYRNFHPPSFGKGAFMKNDVVSGCIQGNDEFFDVFRGFHGILMYAMGESFQEVPSRLGRQVGRLTVSVGRWIKLEETENMGMLTQSGISGNLAELISKESVG